MTRALATALGLAALAGCGPSGGPAPNPPAKAVLTLTVEALAAGAVEVHVVDSELSDTDPSVQTCAVATCSFEFAPGTALRLWATVDGVARLATWSDAVLLSVVGLRLDQSKTVSVRVEDFNLAFVTRIQHLPNGLDRGLGVLAGADTICQDEALDRGFRGTFAAYLSTSGTAARDRIPAGVGGWVGSERPGPFVHDFATGRVLQPLTDYAGRTRILTGTTGWGTPGENCSDWTRGDAAFTYRAGDSSEGLPGLVDSALATCNEEGSLLCLQIDYPNAARPSPVQPQVSAFVTSETYGVGGGVEAFDRACADEAARAGLAGEFVASVATAAASPFDRSEHNPYYRWTRADGVALRPSSGLLQLTADNRVVLRADTGIPAVSDAVIGEARVWTGTEAFQLLGSATCGDWTSTLGTANVTFAHRQHWGSETAPCSGKHRLYCITR